MGMFGKFVEADVAAVHGHGLGAGGEGKDAGTVVEADDADPDFIREAGGPGFSVGTIDGEELLAVAGDGAGEIVDLSELVALADVFESTGIIFGGEEVIAVFEPKAFADVLERVGESPADADGFLGQGDRVFSLGVDRVFRLDPCRLVGHEMSQEGGFGIEGASVHRIRHHDIG